MGCALGAGSSRACLQERAAAGGSSSAEERGRAELLKEERYLRETGCLKPISAGDQRNGGDRSLQAGLLPQRCVRGRSGAAPRPLCSRCAPCPAAPSAGMELRLRSALASRSLKRMSKSSWPGAVLLPLFMAQRAARLCWSPRFGHIPTPGAPLPPDRGRSPVPSREKHTTLISLQVPSARCRHSPVPRLWRYPAAACQQLGGLRIVHLSGPPSANVGSANAAVLCFGVPPPLTPCSLSEHPKHGRPPARLLSHLREIKMGQAF